MKDGRTHLAHKAEHAIDMETGAIVAVTVQGADKGDTTTLKETLIRAAENIEEATGQKKEMAEVVADDQRQIEFPQRRLEIPTQGLKKKSCSRPLRRPFPRSSFL